MHECGTCVQLSVSQFEYTSTNTNEYAPTAIVIRSMVTSTESLTTILRQIPFNCALIAPISVSFTLCSIHLTPSHSLYEQKSLWHSKTNRMFRDYSINIKADIFCFRFEFSGSSFRSVCDKCVFFICTFFVFLSTVYWHLKHSHIKALKVSLDRLVCTISRLFRSHMNFNLKR